jgi:RNA-splicing ligase RtcB
MREVTGKYNTAKIFTDVVDEKSINQVKLLCDQEFVTGSKIRMMPDIHAGAGCTIGTTMTITDKICPNLVGVDIGCGMLCVQLTDKEIDLEKLDKVIRNYIPSGFNVRGENVHQYFKHCNIGKLHCLDAIDYERAAKSIGTLGGGNHFIEVDKDDEGNLYLVIHTGSRHLGKEVAEYYQRWAVTANIVNTKNQRLEIIERLKSEGREKDISDTLRKFDHEHIPDELCWVGGHLFNSYIHDMNIVQDFAKWNRLAIMYDIMRTMNLTGTDIFETIHNYIDTENMILRKGAVSAQTGEKLLIPINMRDGSLICVGKGNPDWNCSAPHGAGRLFGRIEAKRRFGMEEYRESMKDIYTTSVNQDTLDECPMAYKSMDDIVNNIGDTVDILKVIKPIYNFKASD